MRSVDNKIDRVLRGVELQPLIPQRLRADAGVDVADPIVAARAANCQRGQVELG